jgi:hypothetical protein
VQSCAPWLLYVKWHSHAVKWICVFSLFTIKQGCIYLILLPHYGKWWKNFILQKRYHCNFYFIVQIFLYNYLLLVHLCFSPLALLRSDTNRWKVTSNVVKKENKAFCIISDDLFIFFPHSSTLVCEIKGIVSRDFVVCFWCHLHESCRLFPVRGYDTSCGKSKSLAPLTV